MVGRNKLGEQEVGELLNINALLFYSLDSVS